jgi:multidrug efflux pump subunit AcrA (membrane-fusion protein)
LKEFVGMKKRYSQNLARTILIAALAIIAVVVAFEALGFRITRSSPSAPGGASRPAAALSMGSSSHAPSSEGSSAEAQKVPVRESTIALGSISNYTNIQGDVLANSEIKIYPKMDGKILERKVSVGDRVSVGDTIVLVDPSKVGETYLPNPVESTVSGTVLSIPVHVGDTIATTTAVATVGDITQVKTETYLPEIYIPNIKVGTSAKISFDAIPGAIFPATVSEINPVVDPASRTVKIDLRLNRADSRVLVGMSASVRIIVEQKNNIIVAPRAAVIQNTGEGAYVFVVKKDETVERRAVTLGMEGEDSFEIKAGLNVGDKVVTAGNNLISDGSSVKIVDEDGGTKTGALQ